MSIVDISALAEQLQRIEHKLDLLLTNQASSLPNAQVTPVADPEHICPTCLGKVAYNIDIFKGHVVRQCGCSTGKAPGITLTFDSSTETPNGKPEE